MANDRDPQRRRLDVPKDHGVSALVPLGSPVGRFGPVRRRPVADILHREQW